MRRHWTSHLRLLPGGDSDPAVGLGVSLLLYGVSLIFGLIFGLVASSQIAMNDPNLAWVSSLSVANALPAALLGFWILRRLRSTQPIDADVVAVDLRRRRLYPGDEVGRAPQGALLLPARPRQAHTELADGTTLKLLYRVNRDPDELLRLARLLEAKGQSLEDWVREYLAVTVPGLLPDPAGVEAGLSAELLRHGILLTQARAA